MFRYLLPQLQTWPAIRRFCVWLTVCFVFLIAANADLLSAQEFAAATIKPTPAENAGAGQPSITVFPPGGSFRRTNSTLKSLVQIAYGLQDFQVSGGPKWAETDRFDIDAKSEHNASRDEVLRMLQAVLADRFKLKVSRGTKQGSTYALVVAKGGAKLRRVPESEPANVRINKFTGKRSMTQFAAYLSTIVGRLVADRTGLTGIFDIQLEFTPEFFRERAVAGGGPPQFNGEAIDPNGPSIFTALQEQLGLRLEPTKGKIESVVITSADRPTEN